MIQAGPIALGDKESKWILIALAVIIIYFIFKAWGLKEAIVKTVSDPKNPVNRTVEGAYQSLTGDRMATPGGDLYSLGHDERGNANWFGWFLDSVTGQTDLTTQTEKINKLTDQNATLNGVVAPEVETRWTTLGVY